MTHLMKPSPKPHDRRTPQIRVDELRDQYEHALVEDTDVIDDTDELSAELARFEAAYGVLANALQDGE